ncbi:MAG TPA: hypothetical protein VGO03_18430 [Acidimicrobiia bacterium]
MTRALPRTADVGFVLGGVLLEASAFAHWVRSGNGSTLRGHALIDTVNSLAHGHSSAWVMLLTLLWYAIPACGALAWVVVGFGAPHGPSGRALAMATVVIVATIDTFFVIKVGTRAGPGVYLAALGALTLATAVVVPQTVDKSTVCGTTSGQVRGTSRSS